MANAIREALEHATQALKTCTAGQRDGIKRYIDSLLDQVNR